MIGILSIQISNEKRQSSIQREVIGSVNFYVARLKIKSVNHIFDKLFIMSALRNLKKQGIYRVIAPEYPYIKGLLQRYNMTEVSQLPLMRSIAGQLLMYLSKKIQGEISVTVYARKIDIDVMRCIRTACDSFKIVQLDLGTMTEAVRRQMMEEYGSSPIIGELSEDENQKIRVLFDRPPFDELKQNENAVILNVSGRPIENQNYYDDIEAEFLDIKLPRGTDSIGVLTEIVKNHFEMSSHIRIVSLVKKT